MRIGLPLLVILISATHFMTAKADETDKVSDYVEKLMMAPGEATNPIAKTRALTKLVGQFKSLPVLAVDPEVKQTIAKCVENGAIEAYLNLADQHFLSLWGLEKDGEPVTFLIVSAVARNMKRWNELMKKDIKTIFEEIEWLELEATLKWDIEVAKRIFSVIKEKHSELLEKQALTKGYITFWAITLKERFSGLDPLVKHMIGLTSKPARVTRHHQ